MKKWSIQVLIFFLPFVLAIWGLIIDDTTLLVVGFGGMFYGHASSVAKVDREVGYANTTLPLWLKRTLFPTQQNPFYWKTIIFQIFVVVSTVVAVVFHVYISYLSYEMIATKGKVVIVHLALIALLGILCDMSSRKLGQIERGIRPDPRNQTNEPK